MKNTIILLRYHVFEIRTCNCIKKYRISKGNRLLITFVCGQKIFQNIRISQKNKKGKGQKKKEKEKIILDPNHLRFMYFHRQVEIIHRQIYRMGGTWN